MKEEIYSYRKVTADEGKWLTFVSDGERQFVKELYPSEGMKFAEWSNDMKDAYEGGTEVAAELDDEDVIEEEIYYFINSLTL